MEELPSEGALAELPQSIVREMSETLKLELKIEQLVAGTKQLAVTTARTASRRFELVPMPALEPPRRSIRKQADLSPSIALGKGPYPAPAGAAQAVELGAAGMPPPRF